MERAEGETAAAIDIGMRAEPCSSGVSLEQPGPELDDAWSLDWSLDDGRPLTHSSSARERPRPCRLRPRAAWALERLRRLAAVLAEFASALRRRERERNEAASSPLQKRWMGATPLGWALRLLVVAAAAALVGLYCVYRPERLVPEVLVWARARGAAGPALLAGFHALCTVLLVPGSLLCFGAGFVFGAGWGLAAVLVGEVAGAVLAFLIGRHFLAARVDKLAGAMPKLAAVQRAIARRGRRLVLLLRLSPLLPFGIINYVLSATPVRLFDYAWATAAGALPSTFLFVYAGSLADGLDDAMGGLFSGPPEKVALAAVGCAATLASSAAVSVYSTRAVRDALREAAPCPPKDPCARPLGPLPAPPRVRHRRPPPSGPIRVSTPPCADPRSAPTQTAALAG
eukprot:tig00000792_g4179.t1